jgi:type I restriction enzyme S subunit
MEFVKYTIDELSLVIKTGKTPLTSNPEYFDGEIVWLTPSDLKGKKIVDESERKLSKFALEKKQTFLYRPNTVLISTIGDIGKACIVKNPVASNQQLTGVLVNDEIILPELFYYWILRSKRLLENKANKAVISILSNKLLRQIKVAFPKEIEEQTKIVARLNKIQELIDKRVETIQLLDDYIRSVFLEVFLEKGENWIYKPLKETRGIRKRIQGTGKKSNDEGEGFPMLRMNNLSYRGDILLDDLKWVKLSENETSTFKLEDRNILFNRTNSPELVGKISVWNNGGGYTFAGYLVKLELNESVLNPYYLAGYFNSDFGKKVLRSKARLSGNLANISGSTFLDQLILLPPIDLQNQFEKIYLKIKDQREKCQQQLEILKTLFKSSLQNAFSEDAQINEEEVFESLLLNFSKQDLKQGERLNYLINWLNKEESCFSEFKNYDEAWGILRDLLDDGSIQQVLEHDEIKLKVVK